MFASTRAMPRRALKLLQLWLVAVTVAADPTIRLAFINDHASETLSVRRETPAPLGDALQAAPARVLQPAERWDVADAPPSAEWRLTRPSSGLHDTVLAHRSQVVRANGAVTVLEEHADKDSFIIAVLNAFEPPDDLQLFWLNEENGEEVAQEVVTAQQVKTINTFATHKFVARSVASGALLAAFRARTEAMIFLGVQHEQTKRELAPVPASAPLCAVPRPPLPYALRGEPREGLAVGDRVAHVAGGGSGAERALELQVLSLRPRVFRIAGFLDGAECDAIMSLAEPILAVAGTGVGLDSGVHAKIRRSKTAWLNLNDDGVAERVARRSYNVSRVPWSAQSSGEQLQVVNYGPGDFYNAHRDFFEPRRPKYLLDERTIRGGNRFATVLFYLNDVEGGDTFFPLANGGTEIKEEMSCADVKFDTGVGLRVKAKRGDALLFYSAHQNGTLDAASLHGSCPVTGSGMKWAANQWIWHGEAAADAGVEEGGKGEKERAGVFETVTGLLKGEL